MESEAAVSNEIEPVNDQQPVNDPQPVDPDETPGESGESRTRRALLLSAAAAAGAFAAEAIVRPASVRAADVVLGGTNTTTTPTVIQNSTAGNTSALVGRLTNTGSAPTSAALWGDAKGAGGVGLQGTAHNGVAARGVLGYASAGVGIKGLGGVTGVHGDGSTQGVKGTSTSNSGVVGVGGYAGVYGTGPYGTYGTGTSAGAIGTSTTGYGLYGLGPVGVVGLATGNGYGVWGYASDSSAYGVVAQGGYRGVYGSGGNAGVYGTSGYVGLWGEATTTSGVNYGVYANTGSQASGWAGVFNGRVYVAGLLTKAGGGFMIDHPLEPARRYLVHSFVESPEMLNVYSGTATLNSQGQATVKLPGYFSAENKNFRYQLTAIGGPAPNLHVASAVANNAFRIAGGAAGQQVSWQVTGVRQDAWAKAHPLQVEPLKSAADRGKYLNPEAFGKSPEEAIHHLRRTDRAPQVDDRPEPLREVPEALREAS